MVEHIGRDWVRQRVRQELAARQWNASDLARAAGVDFDTVSDFLSGARWPQSATRSKIAGGLGWTPDSLLLVERGSEPVALDGTVSPGDQDAGVLLDLPAEALAGLSEADREEVIAAAKLSALERAREIRRRLSQ